MCSQKEPNHGLTTSFSDGPGTSMEVTAQFGAGWGALVLSWDSPRCSLGAELGWQQLFVEGSLLIFFLNQEGKSKDLKKGLKTQE